MPRSVNPVSGIKGIDKVLSNLNKEIQAIQERSLKGLIIAGAEVLNDVDKTSPLIPVDLGNLRSSRFLVSKIGTQNASPSFKNDRGDAAQLSYDHAQAVADARSAISGIRMPVVILGYSANYSIPVHEREDVKNWSRPGSGPKFLEASLKRNKAKILQTIKDNAKIV